MATTRSLTIGLLTGVTAVCLLWAAPMSARGLQSHDSIRHAAADFAFEQALGQTDRQPVVKAGRLDSRLRLARCDVPLEAFSPRGGRTVGNVSVGIRCLGPKPWTLFVATYVSLPGDVLVANRFLARGELVTRDDVRLEERDLPSKRVRSDLKDAVGKRVKRALRVGRILTPRSLAEPKLVKRGKRVTLVLNANGLEIRAVGEALRDGARGDIVQVKNLSSRRVVEGTVDGTGIVRVQI